MSTEYREVDHHGPRAEALHAVRTQIDAALSDILYGLHDARAMDAGEMWTIPIGLSCGFEGALVVYVTSPGPEHPKRGGAS